MPESPWWNVTVTVGQERFGGMGDSLAAAIGYLRDGMTRGVQEHEQARLLVEKELDRVRL